jgi:hypothetical protein
MGRLELSPDGHKRIMEDIQAVQDAVNKGLFNLDAADQFLQEASRALYGLRQTLNEALLLVPGPRPPRGPGAA